jgi:hypothetical protein
MIAGTVPYQHAGTPAWLIPTRPPLWYMEAIASMYTILASIGCGPHVSSSALASASTAKSGAMARSVLSSSMSCALEVWPGSGERRGPPAADNTGGCGLTTAAIALLLGQALERVGRGAWGHRLCSTPTMWRGGSKAPRPLLPWGAAGRRWPNDSLAEWLSDSVDSEGGVSLSSSLGTVCTST